MGHHGDEPFFPEGSKHQREFEDKRFAELREMIEGGDRAKLSRALLDTTGFIGATGLHPEGKLSPDDEGGIQFRVGSENGKVVLDFGKPIQWVGMDAQQAADLASSLMKWARIVGRKDGETVTLNLGAT